MRAVSLKVTLIRLLGGDKRRRSQFLALRSLCKVFQSITHLIGYFKEEMMMRSLTWMCLMESEYLH